MVLSSSLMAVSLIVFMFQIGPQMLVLGDEAREHGLGRSLLQRLHEFYCEELPFDNPYTGQ